MDRKLIEKAEQASAAREREPDDRPFYETKGKIRPDQAAIDNLKVIQANRPLKPPCRPKAPDLDTNIETEVRKVCA